MPPMELSRLPSDLAAVETPEVDVAALQAEVALAAGARRGAAAPGNQVRPRRHPLHRSAGISPHPPLRPGAPLVGPIVVTAERAVRRALRWYLWPITGAISDHNRAVADAVEAHRRELARARMDLQRAARDVGLLEPLSE